MNTVVKATFAVLFLLCTAVFAGFVAIAWLGVALGLAWMAAASVLALALLWRIYRYLDGPSGRDRGTARN